MPRNTVERTRNERIDYKAGVIATGLKSLAASFVKGENTEAHIKAVYEALQARFDASRAEASRRVREGVSAMRVEAMTILSGGDGKNAKK